MGIYHKEGVGMFEKFGEFDSAEELNRAAAAQLKEEDNEALYALASENGIDKEDVDDYINGYVDELVNDCMAADGKLNIEAADLKAEGIISDWKDYIMQLCADDRELTGAVRKKGKRLSECLGKILEYSYKNRTHVPDKVVKAAGLNPPLDVGFPDKKNLKNIIYKYYTGKETL